jgi:hypothetical protein
MPESLLVPLDAPQLVVATAPACRGRGFALALLPCHQAGTSAQRTDIVADGVQRGNFFVRFLLIL